MNPKKLIQAIGDCNRSRQERIFLLLVSLGLIGLAAGVVSGAVSGGNISNLIAMTVAFVLLFGIAYLNIRCHKIPLAFIFILYI